MIKPEKSAALAEADAPGGRRRRYARPRTAAKLTDVSRSFVYVVMGKGLVKSHKVGGVRLVDLDSLEAFIAGH